MSDGLRDRLDELVDTDPLALRDEALALLTRAEQAEAERDQAQQIARHLITAAQADATTLNRVRDAAEQLAGLAPPDDGAIGMPGTIAADIGRRFLALLDGPAEETQHDG